MKHVAGIWLPDSDQHMAAWLERSARIAGKGTYQLNKVQAALGLVKRFGVAVDVGAHVGTWSRLLALEFAQVVAFEPCPAHQECFRKNLDGVPNVQLVPWALGATEDVVGLHTLLTNTGETWVIPPEQQAPGALFPMARLDRMLAVLGVSVVDLLKIDCEGYEPMVLQGARTTITQHRPVIIVEQDPKYAARYGLRPEAAVPWLRDLGYEVRGKLTCDHLLVHPRSVHAE